MRSVPFDCDDDDEDAETTRGGRDMSRRSGSVAFSDEC